MAIKLRPYSEIIKENMSKEDLIGWIGELEAEITRLQTMLADAETEL